MVLYSLLFHFFLCFFGVLSLKNDCFKMHQDKFPHIMQKDGEFRIIIRDSNGKMASRFMPGNYYKLTLTNGMYGMNFKGFSLFSVLDEDNEKVENEMMSISKNLGIFVLPKQFGVVDGSCPNRIYSPLYRQRTKVVAFWHAPLNPIKCIKFKAQVVTIDSMVFENTGGLEKVICPTKTYKIIKKDELQKKEMSHVENEMVPMIKECCACGVASYMVTFSGLWSKKTHPKEWPTQPSMLHWTNLIGATHTTNYFIYHNGGQASQAVQSICAYGDSTVLKQQFATESVKPQLKSYFNTSGMWNENELEGSRHGYISVNRTHHLFSFLTMMGPSSDWCTGIAAVDLCLPDCSWKDEFSMDLYPFDAGIKHGFTYLPDNSDRLDVPDPIRIINSTIMKEYPFTPEIPVARVDFKKIKPKNNWECTKMASKKVTEFNAMKSNKDAPDQFDGTSLIKKRKHGNKKNPLEDPTLANMATFLCITSEWSDWSRCSVTCGIGIEMRSREMIKNAKTELCRHLPLKESRTCEGRKRSCDFSAPCSLLPWSRWSPCNATCETNGFQFRSRMFAREEEKNKCLMKSGYTINIMEKKSCRREISLCDPVIICSEGLIAGSKCGKVKDRFYYDASKHSCLPFKYLGCKGSLNNFHTKIVCEETCLEAVNALPQWRKDRMAHLQFQSQSKSENRHKEKVIAPQCLLEVKYGSPCPHKAIKSNVRYYYNHRNGKCRQFRYAGCKGNSNNFLSYHGCIKACMPDQIDFLKTAPVKDCEVSEWSSWGPCSVRCGVGEKIKWRSVLRPVMNGGKPCPDLFISDICVGKMC